MSDWVGIKRAVNSSMGTEAFVPLDQMLREERATGEVKSLLKTNTIVDSAKYYAANTESTVIGSFSFSKSEYSAVPEVMVYANARSYNSNYAGYIFITSQYSSATAYSTLNASAHNGMITCYNSSSNSNRITMLKPDNIKLDTTYYIHVCNKASSTSSSYRTYIYSLKIMAKALCGISTVSTTYNGIATSTTFTMQEDGYVYLYGENSDSQYDVSCYIDGNLAVSGTSKVTSAPIALSAGTHTFGINGTYVEGGDYSTSTNVAGYVYLGADAKSELAPKSCIKSIQYITAKAGVVTISPVNVKKTAVLLCSNSVSYVMYATLMGPGTVSVSGSGIARWAIIEFY